VSLSITAGPLYKVTQTVQLSENEMVNGCPILQSAWKRQHGISFIYRSYHLPIPDPSPSILTVLNSNFLQLGRRSGGQPQRTFYPWWLPVNCETQCISGNWTHNLPMVSPTCYHLCYRDHQKKGDAYLKEQSVICKEEDADGWARVTADEKRVLHVKWTEFRLCR